ncbi:hypothetical protein AKO1_002448 [Acrasis kona]|uniref:Uncharacterized protein n=1 Tax=Acrasis kona TaxID=1008807 RepID=A0AAW2YUF8_9EUKA
MEIAKVDYQKAKEFEDEFGRGRSHYTFRYGYFPNGKGRVGGDYCFCNQGNSVLRDGQVLLLQMEGSVGFQTGWHIFYFEKEDVGDFNKVKVMISDNA